MSLPLSIAITSDENYLDGLIGTLIGAVRMASPAAMQAVILDCGIQDTSWVAMAKMLAPTFPNLTLQRCRITPEQLAVFNPDHKTYRLADASYARLLLPDLLPHLDRIIYLDSDLHIDTDLHALFDVPLDGALVGAVQEMHLPLLAQNLPAEALSATEQSLPAFNTGVLLMDLAAIRHAHLTRQIKDHTHAIQGKFQDQAILNYMLKKRWKPLHPRWNRQRFVTENFSIYRDHPDSVWHFIGKMKPWHFAPRHMRGLVADFHRNLILSGWQPRQQGSWQPVSPAWRDATKATRAFALRQIHRIFRSRSAALLGSMACSAQLMNHSLA